MHFIFLVKVANSALELCELQKKVARYQLKMSRQTFKLDCQERKERILREERVAEAQIKYYESLTVPINLKKM